MHEHYVGIVKRDGVVKGQVGRVFVLKSSTTQVVENRWMDSGPKAPKLPPKNLPPLEIPSPPPNTPMPPSVPPTPISAPPLPPIIPSFSTFHPCVLSVPSKSTLTLDYGSPSFIWLTGDEGGYCSVEKKEIVEEGKRVEVRKMSVR